jgi:branched-chain amino acid transport system substrate-binding protein
MNGHSLRRAALGVALCLLLAAQPAIPAQSAGAPYEINVILSLTGQGAFIGKINHDMFTAFETMIDKSGGIKGQPIHFVFLDDQTSPQVAVQLANGLVAKGVPIILGPTITGTCRAVAAVVANGPVDYCLSPGLQPVAGSPTYSTSTASDDMIGVAIRYFRSRGWKRIARLTTTDATGQQADGAFAKWLAIPENKDVTVVADEKFGVTDISVSAQMARIKATDPQVVVFWCTGTPMGTALRAYGDAGLTVPVYASNSNMTTTQAKQYAAITPKDYYSAAPGYVASVPQSATSKKAQDRYYLAIGAAGLHNDYISGIDWDPALIVVAALEHLGTKATSTQIDDFIKHLTNFDGISGTYNFVAIPQRGLGPDALMVMKYDPPSLNWNSVSGFGGGPKH